MELHEFKANPGKSVFIRIPGPEDRSAGKPAERGEGARKA